MLLSREEEKRLFSKISDDTAVRDKIVSENLFLVESIAKKYIENKKNIPMEKLIATGRIGLEKAIDKYDPNSEFKFSTYSTWGIKTAIEDLIK